MDLTGTCLRRAGCFCSADSRSSGSSSVGIERLGARKAVLVTWDLRNAQLDRLAALFNPENGSISKYTASRVCAGQDSSSSIGKDQLFVCRVVGCSGIATPTHYICIGVVPKRQEQRFRVIACSCRSSAGSISNGLSIKKKPSFWCAGAKSRGDESSGEVGNGDKHNVL